MRRFLRVISLEERITKQDGRHLEDIFPHHGHSALSHLAANGEKLAHTTLIVRVWFLACASGEAWFSIVSSFGGLLDLLIHLLNTIAFPL